MAYFYISFFLDNSNSQFFEDFLDRFTICNTTCVYWTQYKFLDLIKSYFIVYDIENDSDSIYISRIRIFGCYSGSFDLSGNTFSTYRYL